jgi:hypothetical protein
MSSIKDAERVQDQGFDREVCVYVKGVDDQDVLFLGSVVVVNCGGTINMGMAPVRGPAGVVEKKLDNIKQEMERIGINVQKESIFDRPPDSSNIGEVEWMQIIDKLKSINNRKIMTADLLRSKGIKLEKGGIVVTHGTDTLQVTALIAALEFSIQSLAVPIVFTASHSPIEVAGSDGLSNLRKAIFISKERFEPGSQNLPPSVYVLIGQDVHLASRLTKVRTMPDSDGRYFFSFPAPIGRITGSKFHLRIDDAYLYKILPQAPRNLVNKDLPRRSFGIVEHLYVDKFGGASGLEDVKLRASFYRSEIPLEQRGIAFVVQGDFSANPELPRMAKVLADVSRDAPVFIGSMKSFAKIREYYGDANFFLLPKSMTHAKAQAKLRWLLSFANAESCIDDSLNANFAGEVFDSKELPEWINYETFPDKKKGTEVVIVYPDIHWKVMEDAVHRLHNSGHPNPRLFLFGFGDGHVPAVNLPVRDIVRRYVDREALGAISFGEGEISVNDVVDRLAHHIKGVPTPQLKDFLSWKYSIDRRRLRGILIGELVQEIRNRELEKLKKSIEAVITRMTRGRPVTIKNKDLAVEGVIRNIHIAVSEEEASELLRGMDIEWSYDLVDIMKAKFAKLIARRIIKDSVMSSSRLLKSIGQAVDGGIDVRIRSLAVKSRTNTLNYETGNILMILGVNSEDVVGWATRYLRPR